MISKIFNLGLDIPQTRDIKNINNYTNKNGFCRKYRYVVGSGASLVGTETKYQSLFFRVIDNASIYHFDIKTMKYVCVVKFINTKGVYRKYPILYFVRDNFDIIIHIDDDIFASRVYHIVGEMGKIERIKESLGKIEDLNEMKYLPGGIELITKQSAKENHVLFQL